jgi:hypothetical protein
VAADIDDLGDERGCGQRPNAVQVGQCGVGGGGDQDRRSAASALLSRRRRENPIKAAPAQWRGADAVVVGHQGERDLNPDGGVVRLPSRID